MLLETPKVGVAVAVDVMDVLVEEPMRHDDGRLVDVRRAWSEEEDRLGRDCCFETENPSQ